MDYYESESFKLWLLLAKRDYHGERGCPEFYYLFGESNSQGAVIGWKPIGSERNLMQVQDSPPNPAD